MVRFLRFGVLPALAAGAVLGAFLAAALWSVQLEMAVSASMSCPICEKVRPFVFLFFLFVFATGLIAALVLKRLGVRNLFAYLALGAASGLLAEYCYMFDTDVWYTWDFTVTPIDQIAAAAVQEAPSLALSMLDMQPFTDIPLAVGLVCCGLYWLFAARRMPRHAGER